LKLVSFNLRNGSKPRRPSLCAEAGESTAGLKHALAIDLCDSDLHRLIGGTSVTKAAVCAYVRCQRRAYGLPFPPFVQGNCSA